MLQARVLTVTKLIIVVAYYYISHIWGWVVLQRACCGWIRSEVGSSLGSEICPDKSTHACLTYCGSLLSSAEIMLSGSLIIHEHNIKVRNYWRHDQPTTPKMKDRCTRSKLDNCKFVFDTAAVGSVYHYQAAHPPQWFIFSQSCWVGGETLPVEANNTSSSACPGEWEVLPGQYLYLFIFTFYTHRSLFKSGEKVNIYIGLLRPANVCICHSFVLRINSNTVLYFH